MSAERYVTPATLVGSRWYDGNDPYVEAPGALMNADDVSATAESLIVFMADEGDKDARAYLENR